MLFFLLYQGLGGFSLRSIWFYEIGVIYIKRFGNIFGFCFIIIPFSQNNKFNISVTTPPPLVNHEITYNTKYEGYEG